MEQGYPLKPYHTLYSSEFGYDEYSPSGSSQYAHRGPAFPLPSKVVDRMYERTSRGYEPLADARNNGNEPPPVELREDSRFFPFSTWWLLEIFASFLAAGSLATIVVVLRIYDGRSLADVRLPGSLTLNGIVAAMSTLSRVALMVPVGSALSQESWLWFSNNARRQQECQSRLVDLELSDSASRGAWGSALFLLFSRRRYVAYIGAFVTIVSLAFGTFTQQLISIAEFAVTDRDSAFMPGNLPRAETWQYYNGNPAEVELTPPFSIRASIYAGVLSDKIGPITVSCATGNCTWPITSSLAICSECSPSGYELECDNYTCRYTMPSGAFYSLTNADFTSEGIGFAVGYSQGSKYNTSDRTRLYIANFDVVGAPYKTLVQGFDNANVTASECAMWMCVQSYNTSMVAGQLQQDVVMEYSDVSTANPNQGPFENYTFANLPAEMNPSPDITYNVSHLGAASFESLYNLFNGTAFLDLESSAAGSDMVDAIWNSSSNLDPWIKNVATSMTNALRYDDPNPQPPSRQTIHPAPQRSIYDGTGYQLGVQVRWGWIVLPVVCVVLSILFLFMVMIETARSPVAPWKGSVLTYLFIEVDRELKQGAAGGMDRRDGLAKAVGEHRAVLRGDGRGKWSLKAA